MIVHSTVSTRTDTPTTEPRSHSRRFAALRGTGLGKVLLSAPALVLLAITLLWPLALIVARSLNAEGDASLGAFSLQNYTSILGNEALRNITFQTGWLALISTILTVLIAFPVAYLMSRLAPRVAFIVFTLIMLPFWVSILVRLFAFTTILGRDGIVNKLARAFGLGPFDLLFNTTAVVIGMLSYLLPYMVLILYAGMSSVDTSLTTAAKTMGASGRQAFLTVYLPAVRSSVVSGALLIFVLALGFFLTPVILGSPTNMTIPVFIQQQVNIFQWGPASATGVVLLVISLIGYLVAMRIGGTSILAPDARPVGKGIVAREPLRFGPTSVALWTVTVLMLVFMLLPLAVIIPSAFTASNNLVFPPRGLSTRWFTTVLSDPVWINALTKSLVVGVATGVLSTAIALALARCATTIRSPGLRGAVFTVAFAPLVVPVILLAIGNFDVQIRLGMIGTDIGLVLLHTLIAFPLSFMVVSNALAQTDPSLESAAHTMGASQARAFWTIVIPAISPALLGSFIIAFTTSWDEAVLALFQSGLDKTLPVTIFGYLKSGVSPAIAAVAVLLMVPVVLGIIVSTVFGIRRARRASR